MRYIFYTNQAAEQTEEVVENVSRTVNAIQEHMPEIQAFLFRLAIALIIYLIGRKLIKGLLKVVDKTTLKASGDVTFQRFAHSLANVLLYFALVFVIVGELGFSTASLLTMMGSAALAVVLAMQESLSHFAGGVLLLVMRPYKVGDYISCAHGDGVVQSIGLVYTTIQTLDNRIITIPNGILSGSAVTNASMIKERRVDIFVSVSYHADLRRAKEVFEQAFRTCPTVLETQPVTIFVDDLGDSGVRLGGYGFCSGSDYLATKWYVTEHVKLLFDENGIEIPFNQLDVHLDQTARKEG
ncbi:MAG: mechanosensitive ion channel family protein [Lachnospiraceae bacterium]|nr:mechanosensitive ion channel family protein [Lachnospiraceae bacterium]